MKSQLLNYYIVPGLFFTVNTTVAESSKGRKLVLDRSRLCSRSISTRDLKSDSGERDSIRL